MQNRWPGILFWPFSLLYRCIICLRNKCYDYQIYKSRRLNCAVVSVGNIHVGGTGKTPTVIFLAQWFREKGFQVAILSRGYGRAGSEPLLVADKNKIYADAKTAGDEPVLMARKLPGIPVMVDADRVRGGTRLSAAFHPDLILLDDGFQHRRLYRDVDIVTLRSRHRFENKFLLPAGPLREPLTQLKRAHLLWTNGTQKNGILLEPETRSIPCIFAYYRVTTIYNSVGEWPSHHFKGASAVLFCGLANPTSFIDTVDTLGITITRVIKFRDHHYYDDKDLQYIKKVYVKTNADIILTTEKDWTKLLDVFPLDAKWHSVAIAIEPYHPDNMELVMKKLCKNLSFNNSVSQ